MGCNFFGFGDGNAVLRSMNHARAKTNTHYACISRTGTRDPMLPASPANASDRDPGVELLRIRKEAFPGPNSLILVSLAETELGLSSGRSNCNRNSCHLRQSVLPLTTAKAVYARANGSEGGESWCCAILFQEIGLLLALRIMSEEVGKRLSARAIPLNPIYTESYVFAWFLVSFAS